MIIFGTRGVTSALHRGSFHCPRCAAKAPYAHQRVRRFFTLYFIPIIPLGVVGEYVECRKCKATWDPEVLRHDPEQDAAKIEAQFERAVKRTMVLMMLADGVIDDDEIEAIRKLHAAITEHALDEADVRAEIDRAKRDRRDLATYLADLANCLNGEGKEMVIRAAFLVAAADGEFQLEEQALLHEIGDALGMSRAHLRGTLAELEA